jgi:hypothetical protein
MNHTYEVCVQAYVYPYPGTEKAQWSLASGHEFRTFFILSI